MVAVTGCRWLLAPGEAGNGACGEQPGQRGDDRAIGPGRSGCLDMALQHCDLVAQNQDLGVFWPGLTGRAGQASGAGAAMPGGRSVGSRPVACYARRSPLPYRGAGRSQANDCATASTPTSAGSAGWRPTPISARRSPELVTPAGNRTVSVVTPQRS